MLNTDYSGPDRPLLSAHSADQYAVLNCKSTNLRMHFMFAYDNMPSLPQRDDCKTKKCTMSA